MGVELQTERCTRVNWFWYGVVRQSVEKNRRCGGGEGWPGQRWSIDHAAPSASKVVDDGEAPDSNEPEMGRRGSRVADGEVYEG